MLNWSETPFSPPSPRGYVLENPSMWAPPTPRPVIDNDPAAHLDDVPSAPAPSTGRVDVHRAPRRQPTPDRLLLRELALLEDSLRQQPQAGLVRCYLDARVFDVRRALAENRREHRSRPARLGRW